MLSLAEQLRCGRCVFPYTHFRDIRELESASCIEFDLASSRIRKNKYWTLQFVPRHDVKKNAEKLACAIQNAVARRTTREENNTGVFLSGGADSRNIIFGAKDKNILHAMTLCDLPNRETQMAETIAQRADVAHHLFERDPDYYPRNAPRAMALSNGMWNFVDGHFVGIESRIRDLSIDKILTGCYADFLFKGLTQNRRRLQIGKFRSNIYRKSAFQLAHNYLWQFPVLPIWIQGIRRRLEEEIQHVSCDTRDEVDLLSLEAARMFPLSRAPGAASRSSLWRLHAWEPVFVDNDVLDVYQQIPTKEKLNAKTFLHAVDLVCMEARDIPNANDGLPITASLVRKTIRAIGQTVAANNSFTGTVATNGSWPNWNRVKMVSPAMEQHWTSFRKENKELLQEILGEERMTRRPAEWPDNETELLCRTYSVLLWMETLTFQF